jgi:acyl-CoA synthetase (AMP-forming)/AMP-acid ligase II
MNMRQTTIIADKFTMKVVFLQNFYPDSKIVHTLYIFISKNVPSKIFGGVHMTELTTAINNQLQAHDHNRFIKDLTADQWYTGSDIAFARDRMRTTLQEQGVHSGDLVLISLPNSVSHVVALLAALDLNAIAYTINPGMPAPELAEILNRHHYAAAIFGPTHTQFTDELHRITGADFTQTNVQILNHAQPVFTITNQQVAANPLITNFQQHEDSPLGVLMYTSGTTGLPKAVVLTHSQLFAAATDIAESQQLTDSDRSLLVLPLFHINAQVISVLATLVSGGKLVVAPKFSAHRFWSTIEREQITWVSAAPAIIAILLKTKPDVRPVTPQLRFVRSASAPLLPAVQREFESFFATPILQGYGMTEVASQITLNPLGATRAASVGKATGTELTIRDDANNVLPTGETGEISLRGDHVIHGYLDPQYADDFQDGWFHTGDVGYLDEDGYLFIVGRKKELINRSGDKISPVEVENVLIQHPAIRSLAVIGLPDAIYGESVAAVIILEDDYIGSAELSAELQDFAGAKLAKFKVPTRFFYTDHLAAGPTGKIQHTRVRREIMNSLN